ncbi:hypothetical protein M2305_001874 [Gluconobacter cerinus]|nr:hypothetical protein [Gluconobacter cerinus]
MSLSLIANLSSVHVVGQNVRGEGLAGAWGRDRRETMWEEPYLETCCRSTLHRLLLCGDAGRPTGLRDQPCLERLERMGFVRLREDGRFVITDAGMTRHRLEIGPTG